LRRQADVVIELVELKSKIGRDPSERLASRETRHSIPRHEAAGIKAVLV
jgi:hypothetical protein